MRQPKRINTYRNFRIISGLSREDAAQQLGISTSYLEKIENDIRIPGRNPLINMSKVYKCSINELLEIA